MVRARQVGLFQYSAGLGRVLKKSQVAGRFRSGKSVEIFDRVCRVLNLLSGISEYAGYFRVCRVVWVFRVYVMFGFTQYTMILKIESGQVW